MREGPKFLYEASGHDGYSGRYVDVGGLRLLSFASYDYVGLVRCQEVTAGALDAIRRHGAQFPFPRVLLECELHEELRGLLEKMTAAYAVVAPSTTLAHLGALPALIEPGDAAIIEQAAHPSLHAALALVTTAARESFAGTDLTQLGKRLTQLSVRHRRVWYLLDGLDPLTGRLADLDALSALLERFPSLHLYIDDAHATSWCGEHGRGHALTGLSDRSRVVVTLSLNKAFGAAGGVILCADARSADRVRRAPGLLLSGATAPPLLGAAIASAHVHLSADLPLRQALLLERIRWVVAEAQAREVMLADTTESPIFFVPCGDEQSTHRLLRALRDGGIYAGAVVPPLVEPEHAGVRFMVSLHNERTDIVRLMSIVANARNGERARRENST